jgi:hypothetical protein
MGLKLIIIISLAGFEVLTTVTVKSIVLLVVTQCNSVEVDQTICHCNPEGHAVNNNNNNNNNLAPTCLLSPLH